MSSAFRFRFILKDINVTRLWCAWKSSLLFSNVVRKCKRDIGVLEVIQCFRHNFLKSKRTLLLSATAVCKAHDEERKKLKKCKVNIKDKELKALLLDIDGVEELSKNTLYCTGCNKRSVIDKKYPGVVYCSCKDSHPQETSLDGWSPFLEADDVIIWRKEYKPGQGLFAYKVYGRYKDVYAKDFAAVQLDIRYRKAWDNAVAALIVVEENANNARDQAVLHWEVMWPRLFANRDYVYIRRHKEFDVETRCMYHKDNLFSSIEQCTEQSDVQEERPSVHSRAKRKSIEAYSVMENVTSDELKDNKVYVIVSRSCDHPSVPPSKSVIRVTEYWSHMVVKTLDGDDKVGMEFVLTYYDEPGSGGMPAGVAAWASARAAPAFLQRMRHAARSYGAWAKLNARPLAETSPVTPENVSFDEDDESDTEVECDPVVNEQDMESSKEGPDMDEPDQGKEETTDTDKPEPNKPVVKKETDDTKKQDSSVIDKIEKGTQTNKQDGGTPIDKVDKGVGTEERLVEDISNTRDVSHTRTVQLPASPQTELEKEETTKTSWWKNLYPFYYFI